MPAQLHAKASVVSTSAAQVPNSSEAMRVTRRSEPPTLCLAAPAGTQDRCFGATGTRGLDPIEVGVRPVALHQLIVAAHLGKSRAVENDDEIGHSHGAEPVRDQDRNTADVAALRLLATPPPA